MRHNALNTIYSYTGSIDPSQLLKETVGFVVNIFTINYEGSSTELIVYYDREEREPFTGTKEF